jgi:hypothetical protein
MEVYVASLMERFIMFVFMSMLELAIVVAVSKIMRCPSVPQGHFSKPVISTR